MWKALDLLLSSRSWQPHWSGRGPTWTARTRGISWTPRPKGSCGAVPWGQGGSRRIGNGQDPPRGIVSYHPEVFASEASWGRGCGCGRCRSDGTDGVAAALLAVAQAREADKDMAARGKAQGVVASSGGGSAVDAQPGPQDPFGLDHDADDEAGQAGSGGAAGGGGARAAAPARRGGIRKRLFSERVQQPSGGRDEAGLRKIELS